MKRKRTSSPQPPGPALAVRLIVHLLNHILSYVPSPRGVHERYLLGPEGSYVHDSGSPCPFYAILSVQPTTVFRLNCWQYFTSKNFDRLASLVDWKWYAEDLDTYILWIMADYYDYPDYKIKAPDPRLLTPFFRENVVLAIFRSRHAHALMGTMIFYLDNKASGTNKWFYEPRFLGRVIKVWITETTDFGSKDERRYDDFCDHVAYYFFRTTFPCADFFYCGPKGDIEMCDLSIKGLQAIIEGLQTIQFKQDFNKFVEGIVAEVTSVATWFYSPPIRTAYFETVFPELSDPEYESTSVSSISVGRWLRKLILDAMMKIRFTVSRHYYLNKVI